MNVSTTLRRKGTHVERVDARTSVGDAAKRMAEKGIGSVVVFDGEQGLAGVLAERDLLRVLSERGTSAWREPVSEALNGPPSTCKPEDSLRHVMAVMTARRARHLPVVAGDTLVGIVSLGDVVKGLLEDLELEVGVLRDYARARV